MPGIDPRIADERLATALLETPRAAGRNSPALPAGRRHEYIDLITRLFADADRLDAYVSRLEEVAERLGMTEQLLRLPLPDLPDARIAAEGFGGLTDDEVANLCVSSEGLLGLRDFLDDPDSETGYWYLDGMLKVEAARPDAAHDADEARRITRSLRRAGVLGGDMPDSHDNRVRRLRVPPFYRPLLISSGVAAAAVLLLGAGILIGFGRSETTLVASITLSRSPTRGGLSDTILEVKNTSDRRAFVAVVGLVPEQGAALHYRENQQFIDIAPRADRVVQSLPKPFDGAASFLVVVSPYPLGETVREIARAGLPDSDAEVARARLQSGLEGYGHRGFSIQVVRPAPRSR